MIVLDASALLAYLFREAGHRIVEKYVESACISTVNLSEVAGRFTRDGMDASLFIHAGFAMPCFGASGDSAHSWVQGR